MKVVLLETISHLGSVGDVVSVKLGYARNFLFPKKQAVLADERTLKAAEHSKLILEHKVKKARATAEKIKSSLEKEALVIRKKAGDDDKLFGSVTTSEIETILNSHGHAVSRKNIVLEAPLKKVGVYQVPVKLAGGVEVVLSVKVVADKPEKTEKVADAAEKTAKPVKAPRGKTAKDKDVQTA